VTAVPDVVVSGLRFPEGSRWHDGELWFSDMLTGQVLRCDVVTGTTTEVLALDDQASGLGWLPDGSLLVSCMLSRTLRRRTDDGDVQVLADLSSLTPWPINDLVTDGEGRTYLGGFGYDFNAGAPPQPSGLYRVDADGSVKVVAEGLHFPNGSVILPGTSTLVVAETWGGQLSAFDVDDTGELLNQRVWALLPEGCTPDGICVDVAGAIWVASFLGGEFLRVEAGGAVTDRVSAGANRWAIDCVLGGDEGTTLFLLTAERTESANADARTGRIDAVGVAVGGPAATQERP
jgi:sugar lactone lactonase YvrE